MVCSSLPKLFQYLQGVNQQLLARWRGEPRTYVKTCLLEIVETSIFVFLSMTRRDTPPSVASASFVLLWAPPPL